MDEQRMLDLFFQTLELIRRESFSKFSDWKDADDWLFSKLDFTKSELLKIYKDRGILIHIDSAKEDSR